MPAKTAERRAAAARIGALSRHHTPGSPRLIEAERDLAVARLDDYIRRVLATAPPLTPAQRDRLVTLLRPDTSAKTS